MGEISYHVFYSNSQMYLFLTVLNPYFGLQNIQKSFNKSVPTIYIYYMCMYLKLKLNKKYFIKVPSVHIYFLSKDDIDVTLLGDLDDDDLLLIELLELVFDFDFLGDALKIAFISILNFELMEESYNLLLT